MRFCQIVICTLITAFCVGCVSVVGSGKPASERRELASFNEIDVSGSVKVLIGISEKISCEVKGDDNIVPIIKTEVRGNQLRIYGEKSYRPKIPVEILLTVPDIRAIDLSGSGKIVIHGIKRDDLNVEVSGSGNVILTGIEVNSLHSDLSGSGTITAQGVTSQLQTEISGSGSGDFVNLCAQEASAEISGSGTTSLVAMQTVDVKVSGSGSVHYAGTPSLSQSISGSGSVKPIATKTKCEKTE
ncbi:MAG: DUF2807 domain-containing protein [Deltaproteobacteria bacterium]|nr:DUF2807 domain-containing protein [Deltaproteobacteria bacterium]